MSGVRKMKESEISNVLEMKCPSSEILSAFFDGELRADAPERAHISECPKCSAGLGILETLSEDLKTELGALPPDGFTADLRRSLRERLDRKSRRENIPFPLFLRVAAMFAASALVVLTLITDEKKPEADSSTLSKSADPIVFLGDADSATSGEMTSLPVPDGAVNRDSSSAINMSDLTPVGTGASLHSSREFKTPSGGTATLLPGEITSRVRQTWSVPNLKSAEKTFKKLIPSNAKVRTCRDGDESLVFNLVLTKKELAELVANCSDAGFDLLSPAQPQPEQKVFKGEAASRVSYTAVLVPKFE
jgi:hypothetical protein